MGIITISEIETTDLSVKLYLYNILSSGCIGTESEGYFNTWSYLEGLIKKNKEMEVTYIDAEATGFTLERQRDVLMEGIEPGSYHRINTVKYKTPDKGEHEIKFAACILCAGGQSGEIAKHANIGTGSGLLGLPLPIENRYEIS